MDLADITGFRLGDMEVITMANQNPVVQHSPLFDKAGFILGPAQWSETLAWYWLLLPTGITLLSFLTGLQFSIRIPNVHEISAQPVHAYTSGTRGPSRQGLHKGGHYDEHFD